MTSKSSNAPLIIEGKTITEIADMTGLNRTTIHYRHKAGWTLEEIINGKRAKSEVINGDLYVYSRPMTINGLTLKQICELTGLNEHTIEYRVRKGWTMERILAKSVRTKKQPSQSARYRLSKVLKAIPISNLLRPS